jgi:hypothetical protein
MDTTDEQEIAAACANCRKEEHDEIELKACLACRLVKYCGRDCQIAHRPRHKKACKKRADELHEEALFKQPPRAEDCPICFLPLPEALSHGGQTYIGCCAKMICSGCVYANKKQYQRSTCPFCRAPMPENDTDTLQRLNKRLEVNDSHACNEMRALYYHGENGVVRDKSKALEYFLRGAELGSVRAASFVARAFDIGDCVAKDSKKARHYYELAALKGNIASPCILGAEEAEASEYGKALKHWLISSGRGHYASLKKIQQVFIEGCATKEDFEKTVRTHQQYIDEIKSDQRDEAAVQIPRGIVPLDEPRI